MHDSSGGGEAGFHVEIGHFPMIIDSHVHFACATRADELLQYMENISIAHLGLVSLPDHIRINFNPEVLFGKHLLGERAVAFGSLDYADRFSGGGVEPIGLAEQVEELAAAGFDGIKMWEGKPSFQQRIGLRLDDEELDGAFEAAASNGMPVVLHVADPAVFWNSDGGDRLGWNADSGTGTNRLPDFEDLILQAETVLSRHPRCIIIFPHLLFLAGDLERLSRLLDSHENGYLDLSPGLYFYGDLHRTRRHSIDFFNSYRQRILFGTDGMWFPPDSTHLPQSNIEENNERARRLIRFLSTQDVFPNPFAYTHAEIPDVRGLALPKETLESVYSNNFTRLTSVRDRQYARTPKAAAVARGYLVQFMRRLEALTNCSGSGSAKASLPSAESLSAVSEMLEKEG